MSNLEEYTRNLYLRDEYITRNPSLHEEDSPWKVSKIIPLIDRFIRYIDKDEVNVLDVGGGAGLILNAISIYTVEKYSVKVNKFALDLSPGMLEIQKRRNPDLEKALNEDIRKTSLGNKEIDLTLMIDVLEHIPNPKEALEELRRISNFVIFKVPLEESLTLSISNFARRGEPRQHRIESTGHINIYNFNKLKHEIEKHTGTVLYFDFTNVNDYLQKSEDSKKWERRVKLITFISAHMFRLSPKLCSLVFSDHVMILVKCYD